MVCSAVLAGVVDEPSESVADCHHVRLPGGLTSWVELMLADQWMELSPQMRRSRHGCGKAGPWGAPL